MGIVIRDKPGPIDVGAVLEMADNLRAFARAERERGAPKEYVEAQERAAAECEAVARAAIKGQS